MPNPASISRDARPSAGFRAKHGDFTVDASFRTKVPRENRRRAIISKEIIPRDTRFARYYRRCYRCNSPSTVPITPPIDSDSIAFVGHTLKKAYVKNQVGI